METFRASRNAYFIRLAKNKALAYDPFAMLSDAEHSCARFVCGRNVANITKTSKSR